MFHMISHASSRVGFGRIVCASLAAALWLFATGVARAQQTGEFNTRAQSAILMDADTGSVLYQHNADTLAPPASMSKLMTLDMVFKAIAEGRLKMDDEILVSENAWRTGGAPSRTSAMFVPINTRARVDEIIQGIIIQSGNDVSIAVAEHLGGTEAKFAVLMEEEARRIGLKQSTFRNATGLHHPEHLMTARDIALLARHIIKTYPEHYPVFAQREFNYRKHRFINRNPLLGAGIGIDGLKTGHTKEAGYGIVVSALHEGRRLIGVVTGLPDAQVRREEARRLIEWGQRSFATFNLFDADETVAYARVWGGEKWYVPVTGQGGSLSVVLPRFPANQRLKAEIVYQGPLKPPIRKGDEVGTLRVTSSSNATSDVPLVAMEDVERAKFWWQGVDSLVFMALRWANL